MDALILLSVALALVISAIPAYVAYRKGRNFWSWWIVTVIASAFLLIGWVAILIIALVIKPGPEAPARRSIEAEGR